MNFNTFKFVMQISALKGFSSKQIKILKTNLHKTQQKIEQNIFSAFYGFLCSLVKNLYPALIVNADNCYKKGCQ